MPTAAPCTWQGKSANRPGRPAKASAKASDPDAKPVRQPRPAKGKPAGKTGVTEQEAVASSAAKPVSKDEPAGAGKKPRMRTAPRKAGADDLKRIKGVGPKLEAMLNGMGFYHYDQIAKWSQDEIAWVDQNLEGFKGRVSRDGWVAQAAALADGKET